MKRILCLILALALLLCACGNPSVESEAAAPVVTGLLPEPEEAEPEEAPAPPELDPDEYGTLPENAGQAAYFLALPENTMEYDLALAQQALLLCSGHSAENTRTIMEDAGFEVLAQRNFDKPDDSPAHTCACTIARRPIVYGGEMRTLLLVAVRGTNGGEWYSNFDVVPSEDENALYAENFRLCAEDVFTVLREFADGEEDPLFLLCGHSRGAACANLLGLMVNEVYGAENTFVYTFATPATVHGELPDGTEDGNIFNFLNPRDLVPRMPPAEWNFCRAGTDVLLPNSGEDDPCAEIMDKLTGIAPSLTAYYGERHSLTNAGLSDDGLTAFEVFLMVARALAGQQDSEESDASFSDLISEESDLHPLAELLDRAAEDDWTKSGEILTQHLPNTYGDLLAELAEE